MAMPFAPPNGNGVCLYVPQPGCSDTARDDTIRITFTVPDGWASNDSGAAINKPATGWVAPDGMGLLFDRGGWLWSDPCIKVDTVPEIPVGPSVDDFANAIADHPLLDATTPTNVSLGGYIGKYMDLQLPSDISDCTFGYLRLGAIDARPGTEPSMAPLDPRRRRRPRRGGNRGLRGNDSRRPGRAPGDRGLDPDRTLIRVRAATSH